MIIQQTIMNRTSLGREMREIQAKRARAKLSTPKPGARTIQGRR
jgi:YidC/Oxa1 family membrane protein insertase